jgi:polysaccharide export outer membrane protein
LFSVCAAGSSAQNVAAGYVIQPSDVITVKYRLTPEFNFTASVLPDGFISAPLLGSIKIEGLTVPQARDLLMAKAGERLRDPELTIELQDFEKPYFVVGGEVEEPGKFDLRGRVGILEAIAIAGGYKTSAQRSRVVVYRRHDAQTAIALVLKTKELMQPTSEVSGLVLQPGDFVVVPQSAYSKIERYIPLASLALFNPLVWR